MSGFHSNLIHSFYHCNQMYAGSNSFSTPPNIFYLNPFNLSQETKNPGRINKDLTAKNSAHVNTIYIKLIIEISWKLPVRPEEKESI